jgi:beta-glucosidase
LDRKQFLKGSLAFGLLGLFRGIAKGEDFIFPENITKTDDFIWGVSTSAYQVEGAYNEDGKGVSIWDEFVKERGRIKNSDTGNVTCDFYHLYEKDIEMMSGMGIPAFRFSLSWPRIFPEGTGEINQKGIDFYHNVIDKCIAKGIEPWITLYHWDLPQTLELKGGWTNREIISWFSEYVEFCTKEYGDKVKNWIVLNEPMSFTGAGYFLGLHAPGKKGYKNFLKAAHHAALCNAAGGKIAKKNVVDGNIGTSISCSYIEAHSTHTKDVKAAKRYDAIFNRMFIEPLIGLGYPTDTIPALKRIHDYYKTNDETDLQFDFDFIGIQNYTREVVKHSLTPPIAWGKIIPANKRKVEYTHKNWEIYPEGIYTLLKKYDAYGKFKKFYITENGASFNDVVLEGEVIDVERTSYLKTYITSVLKAMEEGVNVKGYFVWSLMDNFEWADGYDQRFGMVYVDYENQKRIIKHSGQWFGEFIKEYGK